MTITLTPFRGETPLMKQAIAVYSDVWKRDEYDTTLMFRPYPAYPNFYGYIACINDETVGMTFGTDSLERIWWHDKVAEKVGADHPALQNAWMLTELAVRAPYRNRGIGSTLLTTITTEQPRQRLLLSTPADNHAARRFYERHGWYTLHPGFAFHRRGKLYAILARTLNRG